MHPDLMLSLCRQRQQELARQAERHRVQRRARQPGFRRWSVSWTRLSPGGAPGTAGQPRSSWMIIISPPPPGRPAR
jgi:hypothetical protein